MKSSITIALCLTVFAVLMLSMPVSEALPRCRPGAMLCVPGRREGRDIIEKPKQDLEDIKNTRGSLQTRQQEIEAQDIDYKSDADELRSLRKFRRFLESRY